MDVVAGHASRRGLSAGQGMRAYGGRKPWRCGAKGEREAMVQRVCDAWYVCEYARQSMVISASESCELLAS